MKSGNADSESTIDEYYPPSNMGTLGIGMTLTDNSPISATYYTIAGAKVDIKKAKGVLIRVEKLANGQTHTSKVIK